MWKWTKGKLLIIEKTYDTEHFGILKQMLHEKIERPGDVFSTSKVEKTVPRDCFILLSAVYEWSREI